MRASILLPVYNGEATLSATLDSLLCQSMADFEIVAVNDGSTDNTLAILEAYANKDSRVAPVTITHGGIVAALNAGLQACRAPLVARMDADDLCHPQRLALQCDFLEQSQETGLVSCHVEFGGCRETNAGYAHYVDWINCQCDHDSIALNRFVESPLAHPSVMFRRDLVMQHGAYRDGAFPEDYELWLRLLENNVRMEKLPQSLLTWNDPPSRLSRTHDNYSVDNFYAIKSHYLSNWLRKNNPHHPDIHLIGAGRVARKRAELLESHGIHIAGYYDIDPRKIGNVINGMRIIDRSTIPEPGREFLVSYVASRGAGGIIADFLDSRGYENGVHYVLAA